MESNCFLVIYLVAWSNLSQYIVSDVSFSAIPIFEMKSFLLSYIFNGKFFACFVTKYCLMFSTVILKNTLNIFYFRYSDYIT